MLATQLWPATQKGSILVQFNAQWITLEQPCQPDPFELRHLSFRSADRRLLNEDTAEIQIRHGAVTQRPPHCWFLLRPSSSVWLWWFLLELWFYLFRFFFYFIFILFYCIFIAVFSTVVSGCCIHSTGLAWLHTPLQLYTHMCFSIAVMHECIFQRGFITQYSLHKEAHSITSQCACLPLPPLWITQVIWNTLRIQVEKKSDKNHSIYLLLTLPVSWTLIY